MDNQASEGCGICANRPGIEAPLCRIPVDPNTWHCHFVELAAVFRTCSLLERIYRRNEDLIPPFGAYPQAIWSIEINQIIFFLVLELLYPAAKKNLSGEQLF
ncbi:MAG: hypothetical protein ABI270_11615 [Nitrosospira sp.]